MMEQGLEEEVQKLINAGYTKDSPGLKAIGYHEWFVYKNKEEICQAIIHNSRKYAKKQYTYIRDIPQSKILSYSGTNNDIEKVANLIKII